MECFRESEHNIELACCVFCLDDCQTQTKQTKQTNNCKLALDQVNTVAILCPWKSPSSRSRWIQADPGGWKSPSSKAAEQIKIERG